MKKGYWLVLSAMLLGSSAVPVWADNPDTGPGCGLGKNLWSDYSHQKSIGPQVLMATTNGTSGSQTFGISSGTSGCTNDGTVFAQYKTGLFAAANYDSLAQEMAQGGGEHLASLAELMGVPAENRPAFFAVAQAQYPTLVSSSDTSPAAMIHILNDGMRAEPALAKVVTQ